VEEGALRLVRDFVNTRDVEAGTDTLSDPAALATWLRDNNLLAPGEPASDIDLDRAVCVREAIRDLLAAGHGGIGGTGAPAAATLLSTTARRCKLRPEFTASGTARLVAASSGVDRGIGTLLVLVTAAMADGRWRRLKVCRNDTCRWAFYDISRSGAGKWCSMAVCGNRSKAAAWRTRQRERGPKPRRGGPSGR
jgi:predicted RNA-binding Zn ribbon-like protein